MQPLTMFHFDACPYCRQAREYIRQLQAENPALAAVEITYIDEKLRPDIAERYDYWYVPTFYLNGEKVHEGAVTKEIVERLLERAAGEGIRD